MALPISQITEFDYSDSDKRLIAGLRRLVEKDPGYWDFRGVTRRDTIHSIARYPAMMVARMQREIINQIQLAAPTTKSIYDPFMGSGIVLVEAIDSGLDFEGGDINPLALLICQVKATSYDTKKLKSTLSNIKSLLESGFSYEIIEFKERDKWFRKEATKELSMIHAAIRRRENLDYRRFFWICLAETARLVSNSRSTTFKMHIKESGEIEKDNSSAIEVFINIARENIRHIAAYNKVKTKSPGTPTLRLSNVRTQTANSRKFDAIITSPPYGDNKTTVPYGQFSYLPLRWINLIDICDDIAPDLIMNPSRIDTSSLGGSRRVDNELIEQIRKEYPKLDNYLNCFERESDNYKKCASFFIDFETSLANITNRLNVGGYIALTVGNRRVGGLTQPMDDITKEILSKHGCFIVESFDRNITHKLMAGKNKSVVTMSKEFIIIARKAYGH